MAVALPGTTVRLYEKADKKGVNPGLRLDRFCDVGNQERQHAELRKVVELEGDGECLKAVAQRRTGALAALPDLSNWTMKTVGPLTLHLSRPSVLENAGICLHPIYGFAYLPGSGLKGMARAYAETVWLHEPQQQKDDKAAWEKIEDVFGRAPNLDRKRCIADDNPPAHRRLASRGGQEVELKACAGSVVFHDAWPTSWPGLRVDIVNCHHKAYYEKGEPPGDWESPSPSYFLAVKSGATFEFAIASRGGAASAESLGLAREWLTGALYHLGAGAKTNAGYGRFTVADGPGPVVPQPLLSTSCEIRLASPAFLAGSEQQQEEDCRLRTATLRGLLRWWWRTMYAGQVSVAVIRSLEGTVFGDTNAGGALSLSLEPMGEHRAKKFDFKDGYGVKKSFLAEHVLVRPPAGRMSGFLYLAYGMDESKKGVKAQRWFLPHRTGWRVVLTARPGTFVENRDQLPKMRAHHQAPAPQVPAAVVLRQAQAALGLLCRFGGVGAKCRKGYGSLELTDPADWGSDEFVEAAARDLLAKCGLQARANSAELPATSSCLTQHRIAPVEVATPWSDPWSALDQLGLAYQE
ncbi:MAG: type III-B CRISPR module RAMP protein Cmr6, partial [Myxococcota bacterium]|nr:type III-B CRISPR module RAMP protein Cmr6 [Myxococcota bacterium]